MSKKCLIIDKFKVLPKRRGRGIRETSELPLKKSEINNFYLQDNDYFPKPFEIRSSNF